LRIENPGKRNFYAEKGYSHMARGKSFEEYREENLKM
jgi:hypothetical protein